MSKEIFHDTDDVEPPPWVGPLVLSTTGILLVSIFLWYCLAFDFFDLGTAVAPPSALGILKLLEMVIMMGAAVSLIYTGYWLWTGRYESNHGWWVTMWSVLGLIGMPTMIALVQAHQLAQGVMLRQQTMFEVLMIGAGGGSAAGLLVGLSTAQALWEAERVADQRDAFVFLNKLLRHNILNSVQIVTGTALQLSKEVDDDVEPRIETIIERGDTIAGFTQNVRSVTNALSGEAELRPVNLSGLLGARIEAIRSSFDDVQFTTEIPDDVEVQATDALDAVFENLLTNAIEHNDSEEPQVDVDVETAGESVLIRITDNGPGIPDAQKAHLFDPKERGDRGLGLYLVEALVSEYGGDVWVEDNEPRGSIFTVRLKRSRGGGAIERLPVSGPVSN